MSMTSKSMDEQTRPVPSGLNDPVTGMDDVAGFDPTVVVQTQDPTIASLKPSDGASWSHCDVKNDYKNQQEG
jgi:hypothetical protein